MTPIIATLTIVQLGRSISIRSTTGEDADGSIPARLIEAAHEAADKALAEIADKTGESEE